MTSATEPPVSVHAWSTLDIAEDVSESVGPRSSASSLGDARDILWRTDTTIGTMTASLPMRCLRLGVASLLFVSCIAAEVDTSLLSGVGSDDSDSVDSALDVGEGTSEGTNRSPTEVTVSGSDLSVSGPDNDDGSSNSSEPADGTGEPLPEPFCGDGLLDASVEECDDGNAIRTDGCVEDCRLAVCGDSFVREGVEVCDDANSDNEDGCTSLCARPGCGDGIQVGGEECDDGNLENTDACLSSCLPSFCGDGHIRVDREQCDDNDQNNFNACPNDCQNPSCGDGILEGLEACDQGDVGPRTCASETGSSRPDGELRCNDATCTVDTGQCTNCGNNVVEPGEECDLFNTPSSCENESLGNHGFLQCFADTCRFNASLCSTCGNRIVDGNEVCDGNTVPCTQLGQGFASGNATCNPTSRCDLFDTTLCTRCGNGQLDAGEQCDVANLGGQSCFTRGFAALPNNLSCNTNCTFNDSGCERCGNGNVDASDEDCDGTDLDGESCQSLGFAAVPSTLSCNSNCTFNTTRCELCGNGVIDTDDDEECDGLALPAGGCVGQGHDGGVLQCDSNCRLDESECTDRGGPGTRGND